MGFRAWGFGLGFSPRKMTNVIPEGMGDARGNMSTAEPWTAMRINSPVTAEINAKDSAALRSMTTLVFSNRVRVWGLGSRA